MATILYPSPVFGPVRSRRLGLSLGINLLPADGKACTFDCIYCECGFNGERRPSKPRPSREEVRAALEARLIGMQAAGELPDVLTFAGNGEPTSHHDFAAIIDDTIRLRDRYCPKAGISVLSNATFAARPEVRDALLRVNNNIQKLDTVDTAYIARVNRPAGSYDVERIVRDLCAFEGHVIVQTIFMKGTDTEGHDVDNTSDAYVLPWIEALRRIRPRQVMIYTIDRETPARGLLKATPAELDRIVAMVEAEGIPATASY